jgi:hypothetical protein
MIKQKRHWLREVHDCCALGHETAEEARECGSLAFRGLPGQTTVCEYQYTREAGDVDVWRVV